MSGVEVGAGGKEVPGHVSTAFLLSFFQGPGSFAWEGKESPPILGCDADCWFSHQLFVASFFSSLPFLRLSVNQCTYQMRIMFRLFLFTQKHEVKEFATVREIR